MPPGSLTLNCTKSKAQSVRELGLAAVGRSCRSPTLPVGRRAIAHGERSFAPVCFHVVMAGLVPAMTKQLIGRPARRTHPISPYAIALRSIERWSGRSDRLGSGNQIACAL